MNQTLADFRQKKLVFVDVETTGLSPIRHEIIEIASIVVEGHDFSQVRTFESKIFPEHIQNAEKEALEINGFNPKDWEGAPSQKKALGEFANIAPGGVIVGWNVSFDWAFLESGFERLGIIHKFDYHQIDAMSVAYGKLFKMGEFKNLGLRKVAPIFGIKLSETETHSAVKDVKATYEVFRKVMAQDIVQENLI